MNRPVIWLSPTNEFVLGASFVEKPAGLAYTCPMSDTSNETLTVYGTPTCPMVIPVRGILDRAGVPFAYVDISKDETGRLVVKSINNGNESVPTLVFTDGSTLTEPSSKQLEAKLRTLGYEPVAPNLRQRLALIGRNPMTIMFTVIFLAMGLISQTPAFIGVGIGLGIVVGLGYLLAD